MLFVLTAVDKDDGQELRLATREAHFAYLRETNVVRLGGPFLNDKGQMIGSLIIFEADDMEAARQWATNDPYAKAGLFKSSSVTTWKPTVNACNAEL